MFYWHSNFHFVWMIVFWVAFIGACAVGLRYALGGARHGRHDHSAESILNRRYASGEIDREEYEDRLSVLHSHTAK